MTARKTIKAIAVTLAATGVTMGTAIAPAAFAATSDEISVKIDTRYLETDWGVEKVYTALSNKAESACSLGSSRGISARKIERDCMSDLLDDFIENAGDQRLATFHATMTS